MEKLELEVTQRLQRWDWDVGFLSELGNQHFQCEFLIGK